MSALLRTGYFNERHCMELLNTMTLTYEVCVCVFFNVFVCDCHCRDSHCNTSGLGKKRTSSTPPLQIQIPDCISFHQVDLDKSTHTTPVRG